MVVGRQFCASLNHDQYSLWTSILFGQLQNLLTPALYGAPETDGSVQTVTRDKIRHYHQIYHNRPDPIAFIPVTVDNSDHIYDDFSRLLLLHTHREASTLCNELPESDQFRFVLLVYIRSRHPIPLLSPSLVLFPPSLAFLILLQMNTHFRFFVRLCSGVF
jgi:hypothetical protein